MFILHIKFRVPNIRIRLLLGLNKSDHKPQLRSYTKTLDS